jgi:uncharacterized Zn finger protein
MMEPLDGNAIAGQLFDVFGTDVTSAIGTCASCGAAWHVAEFAVYLRGPGTVARCRSCGSILMVVATIRGMNCVDLTGVSDIVMP